MSHDTWCPRAALADLTGSTQIFALLCRLLHRIHLIPLCAAQVASAKEKQAVVEAQKAAAKAAEAEKKEAAEWAKGADARGAGRAAQAEAKAAEAQRKIAEKVT